MTWTEINTGLSRLDLTHFDLTGTDLTDTGTEVDWETSLEATLNLTASGDLVDSGVTRWVQPTQRLEPALNCSQRLEPALRTQ